MRIRIYFDTSELRGQGWPRVSAKQEIILGKGAELGAVNVLPSPVEDEVRMNLFRDLLAARDKAAAAVEAARRLLPAPGTYDPFPPRPYVDLAQVESSYDQAVREWKGTMKAESCPLTPRTTGEMFQNAIRHEVPFSATEMGYQDKVIYLSVLEDLRKYPDAIGLLVTSDKGYRDPSLRDAEAADGIRLHVLTLDQALDWLREKEADVKGQVAVLFEARLLEELQGRTAEIQEFIRNNLGLQPSDLCIQGELSKVSSINLLFLKRARANPPGLFSGVPFVADGRLEIVFSYRILRLEGPPPVRLGDDAKTAALDRLLFSPMVRPGYSGTMILKPPCEVTGRIGFAEGRFTDLHLLNARLRPCKEWITLQDQAILAGYDPYAPPGS